MPRKSPIQRVRFAGFSDGLNRQVPASRLQGSELSMANDVLVDDRGVIRVRGGWAQNGYAVPDFVWISEMRDGVNMTPAWIAITDAGDIWTKTELGSWTDAYNVGNPWTSASIDSMSIASAGGTYWLMNYNGSVSESNQILEISGSFYGWISTILGGKKLIEHHNRLYSCGKVGNRNRVTFSDPGDYTAFAASNYIEVGSDIDPELDITTAEVFGDDLIIFKKNEIWKMTGSSIDDFALFRIDAKRGTNNPNTVKQLRGRLFFYDEDTGVWAFDGASLELVSQAVNDYLLENRDYTGASPYETATAYVEDDRYFLSVPANQGRNERWTYCFYAAAGVWSIFDGGFGIVHYSPVMDEHLMVTQDDTGSFYWEPTEKKHLPNGSDKTAVWRTPWINLSPEGTKARVRRIEALIESGDGSNTTDLTVKMYANWDESSAYVTKTLSRPAASLEEWLMASDGWGNKLKSVMFEFSTDMNPFAMHTFAFDYSGGDDIRGNYGNLTVT